MQLCICIWCGHPPSHTSCLLQLLQPRCAFLQRGREPSTRRSLLSFKSNRSLKTVSQILVCQQDPLIFEKPVCDVNMGRGLTEPPKHSLEADQWTGGNPEKPQADFLDLGKKVKDQGIRKSELQRQVQGLLLHGTPQRSPAGPTVELEWVGAETPKTPEELPAAPLWDSGRTHAAAKKSRLAPQGLHFPSACRKSRCFHRIPAEGPRVSQAWKRVSGSRRLRGVQTLSLERHHALGPEHGGSQGPCWGQEHLALLASDGLGPAERKAEGGEDNAEQRHFNSVRGFLSATVEKQPHLWGVAPEWRALGSEQGGRKCQAQADRSSGTQGSSCRGEQAVPFLHQRLVMCWFQPAPAGREEDRSPHQGLRLSPEDVEGRLILTVLRNGDEVTLEA